MLPRLRFEELFADNGGGRNGQTIRVYLKAWEGWIEAEDALAGDEIQDLHGLESLACCIRQDKHGCMRVRQTEANCNCEACVGRFCIEKTGDWPWVVRAVCHAFTVATTVALLFLRSIPEGSAAGSKVAVTVGVVAVPPPTGMFAPGIVPAVIRLWMNWDNDVTCCCSVAFWLWSCCAVGVPFEL
ncbi:hypothetical protein VSR82_35550 [Burkholderia sp. JPY481]